MIFVGVQETVLLVNRAFVPPKKMGFWRKRRKWRICVLTSKTRALLLKPREATKLTKMAGVPQAKAWFTKGTVFCSLILASREVFSPTSPWYFPTDISNFKSRFTKISQGASEGMATPRVLEELWRSLGWIQTSELFTMGPVQFSWPRGVAENSFTKPGF